MQPRAGCLSITCPPELLEPIFGGVSCTNHACTNCGAGFAERFMLHGDAGDGRHCHLNIYSVKYRAR